MRSLNTATRLLFAVLSCLAAMTAIAATNTLKSIETELEQMLQTDQAYRKELVSLIKRTGDQSEDVRALWSKQKVIDDANTKRLIEIVELHGWPLKSVVGDAAAHAAFLVLQHADHETQKTLLPQVRIAAETGEMSQRDFAMLVDRILVRDGKPQLYGTQSFMSPTTKQLTLRQIEDAGNVNKRRLAIGLDPLNELPLKPDPGTSAENRPLK
jgi:hypothetical protein